MYVQGMLTSEQSKRLGLESEASELGCIARLSPREKALSDEFESGSFDNKEEELDMEDR